MRNTLELLYRLLSVKLLIGTALGTIPCTILRAVIKLYCILSLIMGHLVLLHSTRTDAKMQIVTRNTEYRGVARGGSRGSDKPPLLGTLTSLMGIYLQQKSHILSLLRCMFSADFTGNNHPTFAMQATSKWLKMTLLYRRLNPFILFPKFFS